MHCSPSHSARPALLPTCTPCGSLGAGAVPLSLTSSHSHTFTEQQPVTDDPLRSRQEEDNVRFARSDSCWPPFILPKLGPAALKQYRTVTAFSSHRLLPNLDPANKPVLRSTDSHGSPADIWGAFSFHFLVKVLWLSFCCCTTFCLSLYSCTPSLNWENSQHWLYSHKLLQLFF